MPVKKSQPQTRGRRGRTRADVTLARAFAERVQSVRHGESYKGMSDSRFADEVGIPRETVRKWLSRVKNAKQSAPSTPHVVRFATATGRSLDWLLDGVGPERRGAIRPDAEAAEVIEAHVAAVLEPLPAERRLVERAWRFSGKRALADICEIARAERTALGNWLETLTALNLFEIASQPAPNPLAVLGVHANELPPEKQMTITAERAAALRRIVGANLRDGGIKPATKYWEDAVAAPSAVRRARVIQPAHAPPPAATPPAPSRPRPTARRRGAEL